MLTKGHPAMRSDILVNKIILDHAMSQISPFIATELIDSEDEKVG